MRNLPHLVWGPLLLESAVIKQRIPRTFCFTIFPSMPLPPRGHLRYYTLCPVHSKQSTSTTKIKLFSHGSHPEKSLITSGLRAMCSLRTWCQRDPQAKISSISTPWRDQGHQQRPQGTPDGESFLALGEALFLSLTVPLGSSLHVLEGDEVNQWSSKQTNKTFTWVQQQPLQLSSHHTWKQWKITVHL